MLLVVARSNHQLSFGGLLLTTSSSHAQLLFGTPHHGTDNEDTWDRVAEGFWPLATAISSDGTTGRSSADRSPLVKALKRDSHVVLDISDDFRSLTTSYALVSFYETFAWPHTEAAIVPKSSALLGLAHEDQVPLAADRAEMVRFDGLDDPMFVQVERRIRKAAKGREREEEVERVENTKNRMPLTLEFGQMGSMMWTTKIFSDRYDIASQLNRSQV
ncbi:hypothetical protein BDZ45DRAFT_668346 [Acephala macrosclerotiorum]|nr:hypothetical protein BDZ45DRAFT_668346 [Acephala macrosclerotiorum]